jgi:hypothetical protein
MAMKTCWLVVAICGLAFGAMAEPGDDTLAFFLSKAELVVVGEVQHTRSDPYVEVKVLKTIMGKLPEGQMYGNTMPFRVVQPGNENVPYFHTGAKCIFFLKAVLSDYWFALATADPWFGIQPYTKAMRDSLQRLIETRKNE